MGPCTFDARGNPSSRSRISTHQARKRNQDKFQPSGQLDLHANLLLGLGLLRSLSCSSLTFLVYKDQCFGYFKIVKGLAQHCKISFVYCLLLTIGTKGVAKEMKKICSGPQQDEGVKWFTDLSDKGI